MGARTLAVWCPDWPVTAAGHRQDQPVAVMAGGRVVACSAAARTDGVTPGLRRRQAESRCSGLMVVDQDPARDARAFEPVATAVETAAPAVEILRPGLCVLPVRGPARYYGSEGTAAAKVAEAVGQVVEDGCRTGVADGLFAACQAAREGIIVAAGATQAFLAGLPVEVLDEPADGAPGPHGPGWAGRFRRLGLTTLGAFAALPAGNVMERFGTPGARVHRLARGLDGRAPSPRQPPPELAVTVGFDPPADRLDVVLFAARQLAAELAGRLEDLVLACTLVAIQAETAGGQSLLRRWRHEDGLTPDALAERLRWQVEAWLVRSAGPGPHAGPVDEGLVRLRLVPELVHPERGRQLAFWGERATDGRAARALARVQAILGVGSVVTAVVEGGRTPGAQVRLIPWGETRPEDVDRERGGRSKRGSAGTAGSAASAAAERPPWPGRIPPPAPATVHADPPTVGVTAAGGDPVRVDDRGEPSGAPARLSVPGRAPTDVVAWAGPWPADERWWDPPARSRRTRLQVLLADGTAHLVALQDGRWLLEATYD